MEGLDLQTQGEAVEHKLWFKFQPYHLISLNLEELVNFFVSPFFQVEMGVKEYLVYGSNEG